MKFARFFALLMIFAISIPFASSAPRHGSARVLVSNQSQPVGMVVESKGTLYWVSWGSGQLLALAKAATSPTVLLNGLNSPQSVGVDGAGNLYYTEYFRGTISVLPAGSSTPSVLLSGLSFPNYLSVDSVGNVFFIQGETCGDRISKYDHVAGMVATILTAPGPRNTDLGFGGVFIHPSGDLYYTTCARGTVERLRSGSSTPEVILTGLRASNGIAVDVEGNIFFTEYYTRVSMLESGSDDPTTLATEGRSRNLLTIDAERNVYYSDNIGGVIWKVPKVLTISKTQQVPASTPQLVDSQGRALTVIQVDQLVTVQTRVRNNDTITHKFTYIIQIKDSNQVIDTLAWIRDLSLTADVDTSPGLSWRPTKAGAYTIEVYIWNSVTNQIPFSPVVRTTVTVNQG
jgi:sugar lactone lactonase YvrE